VIDLAKIEFVVDPDSESVDLDSALARFLLQIVRASAEAPSGGESSSLSEPFHKES
jgi:hypothetical protein